MGISAGSRLRVVLLIWIVLGAVVCSMRAAVFTACRPAPGMHPCRGCGLLHACSGVDWVCSGVDCVCSGVHCVQASARHAPITHLPCRCAHLLCNHKVLAKKGCRGASWTAQGASSCKSLIQMAFKYHGRGTSKQAAVYAQLWCLAPYVTVAASHAMAMFCWLSAPVQLPGRCPQDQHRAPVSPRQDHLGMPRPTIPLTHGPVWMPMRIWTGVPSGMHTCKPPRHAKLLC